MRKMKLNPADVDSQSFTWSDLTFHAAPSGQSLVAGEKLLHVFFSLLENWNILCQDAKENALHQGEKKANLYSPVILNTESLFCMFYP